MYMDGVRDGNDGRRAGVELLEEQLHRGRPWKEHFALARYLPTLRLGPFDDLAASIKPSCEWLS